MISIRLYTVLFGLESIIVFIALTFYNLINDKAVSYNKELQFIILMTVWKLLIYYIPLVLIFIFFNKYFIKWDAINKSILFSIFNVIVFIGLNFLYKAMDLPSFEINEFLFWVTCISITISPVILGQIPYFKKLMENL